MASKGLALLLFSGLGAGLYLATRPGKAATLEPAEGEGAEPLPGDAIPPIIPDEAVQQPEDIDWPTGQPPGAEPLPPGAPGPESGAPPDPGNPPAGSGAPEILSDWVRNQMDSMPPILTNINLSGNERYEFIGERMIAGEPFLLWAVHDSINGHSISVVVSKKTPSNWISVIHLPQSLTVHRINGDTQADRDWLTVNVMNQPEGSYKANTQ